MKNLSTFSKSIVMAVAIAGTGTATIVASQAATSNDKVSEAVAVVQSKISLQQAMASDKTIKGDLVNVQFDQNDYSAGGEYEIKSIANNMEYEIKIDADTGKVLSAKQKRLDKEDVAKYKTRQSQLNPSDTNGRAKHQE